MNSERSAGAIARLSIRCGEISVYCPPARRAGNVTASKRGRSETDKGSVMKAIEEIEKHIGHADDNLERSRLMKSYEEGVLTGLRLALKELKDNPPVADGQFPEVVEDDLTREELLYRYTEAIGFIRHVSSWLNHVDLAQDFSPDDAGFNAATAHSIISRHKDPVRRAHDVVNQNAEKMILIDEAIGFIESLVNEWIKADESVIHRQAVWGIPESDSHHRPGVFQSMSVYDVARGIIERSKGAQNEATDASDPA